jgi:hypothetical protein
MAYLHTILAYPSKPRLKGALNRIYAYLEEWGHRLRSPEPGVGRFLTASCKVPVPSDHKSFRQTSPGRDVRIQSPARQCRERKPTETKSPLGDGTTNLLVRLHSNLKSMFCRQKLDCDLSNRCARADRCFRQGSDGSGDAADADVAGCGSDRRHGLCEHERASVGGTAHSGN